MSRTDSTQIWALQKDRERLGRIAERERRNPKHQLTVLLDEACERRGLDPETLEPKRPPQDAAAQVQDAARDDAGK